MIPEHLWAKTTADDKPGKSVLSHLNDVCAVSKLLLENDGRLIEKTGCSPAQVAAFAGLHDIGKISPGFQAKCPEWLNINGLRLNYGEAYESDHSIVTQFTIQEILKKSGMRIESAELWAAILGAHHGRLHKPGVNLRCFDDDWEEKREAVVHYFLNETSLPTVLIDNQWEYFWWLAGLVSVSDWIGSAEDWFPVQNNTALVESRKNASAALAEIGFAIPKIKKGLSFGDVFVEPTTGVPFRQNDLQTIAEGAIQKPGLYIIEAPMGLGKTEAALWCAYQLMQKDFATGFYFALPTQATSNRIHERVNDFLERIVDGTTSARLVHAGSWLLDKKIPTLKPSTPDERESNRDAIDWFASSKRGILASFGVGTIDQALMSIIAVKHFFVRQFALAGKVVILDEVHSYDLYTGTLIKALCDRLLPLGCTIILLSATLTKGIKKRFIETMEDAGREDHYPIITGKDIAPVDVPLPEPKTVKIQVKDENESLTEALTRAKNGASVLWVCDTVNKAQQMYHQAKGMVGEAVKIGLLHSRFPVFRRQELEEYWMEKLGKAGKNRSGCLLFSTQIVEQSVDLDADFMITELAPTDMLLQRMGRLCRHERGKRFPEMWIVAENVSYEEFQNSSAQKIKKMFGTKAMVYAPYVLLRSLRLWKDKTSLELPRNIRSLLEQTYESLDKEPESWQNLHCEMEGQAGALRMFALSETNLWQESTLDEEGKAKTRISNFETVQFILATSKDGKRRNLCNGDKFDICEASAFSLSVAKAIHRNIVKVPAYLFSGFPDKEQNKTIYTHVRGKWQIGYIKSDDGTINCKYLNDIYKLKYTPEKGVEIMKTDQGNEVDNEPCD